MKRFYLVWVMIFYLGTLYGYRFCHAVSFAAGWDQVDFSLAISEYDLIKMQPHFPGYPFFILGGMLFFTFIKNPPEALSILNMTMMLLTTIPLFFLARHYLSVNKAALTVMILQSVSYIAVMTGQPMSEGAALAIIPWYLWSLSAAMKKDKVAIGFIPAILLGLLLGVRLSYVVFAAGLIFQWLALFKKQGRKAVPKILVYCFIALMAQLVWVSALAFSTGGFAYLFQLAFGFTEGHFSDWGGTAAVQADPFWETLFLLIGRNLLWVGLGSGNVIVFIISMVLAVIAVFKFKNARDLKRNPQLILMVLLGAFYFLWALFAQNIDKPRHILPLLMLLVFFIAVISLRNSGKLVNVLIGLFILAQTLTGLYYVRKQAEEIPAMYQLASYLEQKEEKFIVYTWEETRVFQYLEMPFSHKRIYTYPLFLQDIKNREGASIYVTGKAVDGFKQQGAKVEEEFVKVSEFHSEPIFDPVYHHIVLYKWNKDPGGELDE
ncbi:glycosyltransferase family 39 protein [Bacillus sp. ISL-47]|uniref:glycosyltransferase family 39 protein n=1 Tax=Bacillus sp. ISL-47 TaxID=2819130 RepID=UPI001BEA3C74|nr:glycosyltransferase family 39 protein [Bacillus sp. ISL-47]MBT2688144.1 glycosyltransferase family 39 protein [Bacillus sp. ISL-47]MBT2707598.1 glycosyltransferase family 39 protein [Pseudomonas sp. ISL-84]